jgi:hypothetical protein
VYPCESVRRRASTTSSTNKSTRFRVLTDLYHQNGILTKERIRPLFLSAMPLTSCKLLSFIFVILFSTSNALQLVARSDSGARTVGQLSTDDAFRIIDSNKDGKLSVLELQEAASFTWNDVEASNRARITFNLAHPADFVLTYDIDGEFVSVLKD